MTPSVTLIAAGTTEHNAVANRIRRFRNGLSERGWEVRVADPTLGRGTRTGVLDRLLDRAPSRARAALERAGIEGDIRPMIGWRSRINLRSVRTDIVVVSVPPFSLLVAAALGTSRETPLILDYRDPWSAREEPPPLACATRPLERLAIGRAAAIIYAGDDSLGELIARHLKIPRTKVTCVPNGVEARDVASLRPMTAHHDRNGRPLRVVMSGYWYGRNGPGILANALKQVGPGIAQLTVIGGIASPITAMLTATIGRPVTVLDAVPRGVLLQQIQKADAAVVITEQASATESRVPAKVYDYLATGIPVIAICPRGAALLRVPGAERFHHIDQDDVDSLVNLIKNAARDRAILRFGHSIGSPTSAPSINVLHNLLLGIRAVNNDRFTQ